MADDRDYYALLEVSPDTDEAGIRLAYRRLARRYHPDVAGTGSLEHM
ncbi:MAG: DnaJ domain-containing protein, partial [Ktedonobacterales bacterium]